LHLEKTGASDAGVMFSRIGGLGNVLCRRSADPDFEVDARLPCFAMKRREEARMEDVVLMLNVL
jgi:hypothetical protein